MNKKKIGITQSTINESVGYEGNSRKEKGGFLQNKGLEKFFFKYGIIIVEHPSHS